MIRPTDQETVSTGKTACSSQAPGAGPLRVAEATAGSKGGGGGGRRWGRVLTGLPGEGTAEEARKGTHFPPQHSRQDTVTTPTTVRLAFAGNLNRLSLL